MPRASDSVAQYGASLGMDVRPRTVLVEGTSDADLFRLAARLERSATGEDLLGSDLALVPQGSVTAGVPGGSSVSS